MRNIEKKEILLFTLSNTCSLVKYIKRTIHMTIRGVIRKLAEKCYIIVMHVSLSIETKIHKYELLFFAS